MEKIKEFLQKILSARYGKDVRQAIHDAIKQCYEDGKAGSVDLTAREEIGVLETLTTGVKDNIVNALNWLNNILTTLSNNVVSLTQKVNKNETDIGKLNSDIDGLNTNIEKINDTIQNKSFDIKLPNAIPFGSGMQWTTTGSHITIPAPSTMNLVPKVSFSGNLRISRSDQTVVDVKTIAVSIVNHNTITLFVTHEELSHSNLPMMFLGGNNNDAQIHILFE